MVNFRKHSLSSGKEIILGKSAENNEEVIRQVNPTEIVLHTKAPGSPFCNIKGNATKKDIQEAATYTAKYSQDWRDNKKDIMVHFFKGKDISKSKLMKIGTFSVKNTTDIIVKKIDILNLEKELLKDD